MSDWLIWLVIAAVLAAAETASMSLVLVMVAGGAGAAALAAALGAGVIVQIVVAILGTLVLLGAVRPVAIRHLNPAPPAITGSDALVGCDAVVLSRVDRDDGRVRLNGSEWSARAKDAAQDLPAGTVVTVIAIDGATAVVWQDPFAIS